MPDKHNLQRFLAAQGNNLDGVLSELKRGRKSSHWMWYVFPQVQGLGTSATAELYAIRSKAEAIEYLQHPVLGTRLVECTKLVNRHKSDTAEQIFGYPDYLKFCSCMTLFNKVGDPKNPFSDALDSFFGGIPDERTLSILGTL